MTQRRATGWVRGAVATAVAVAGAGAAAAGGWSCSSGDLPLVACDADACTVEPASTPVSVDVDAAGDLAACLFTGCYTGAVTGVLRDGAVASYVAREALWSHAPGDPVTVALTLRPQDGVGVLLVAGYVTPVHCTAREPASP